MGKTSGLMMYVLSAARLLKQSTHLIVCSFYIHSQIISVVGRYSVESLHNYIAVFPICMSIIWCSVEISVSPFRHSRDEGDQDTDFMTLNREKFLSRSHFYRRYIKHKVQRWQCWYLKCKATFVVCSWLTPSAPWVVVPCLLHTRPDLPSATSSQWEPLCGRAPRFSLKCESRFFTQRI